MTIDSMASLIGEYGIDIPNSAKLKAGWFQDRFEMKPGYDEALLTQLQSSAAVLAQIGLSISQDTITLKSPDGSEKFPISVGGRDSDGFRLVIHWHGDEQTLKVREVAPGSIHFDNPENQLSEWVWLRRQ